MKIQEKVYTYDMESPRQLITMGEKDGTRVKRVGKEKEEWGLLKGDTYGWKEEG